jgi:NADH dehydrogenase
MSGDLHVVTGAFGFSGRYIARRLLSEGRRVRTLTNKPANGDPLASRIGVRPLRFDDRTALVESLRGAAALYNTYWVRFNHRTFSYALAVDNTLRLFDAARAAGVGRVVHVSITNASEQSPFEYFRGKARLERALRDSGQPYAIIRPAVLFGQEGILLNNIAWMLRHFPIFGVFGDGRYRLQPIYVDDLAVLALDLGSLQTNEEVDALGPETFVYCDLVATIGKIIGMPRPIVSIPPWLGLAVARVVGRVLGDVLVTRDEIAGLMADLLYVPGAPSKGTTRLTDWARENARTLGRVYLSELARRG